MRCAWLVMVGSEDMRRAATLSSASIRSATPARQEPPPVSTMLRICEVSEARQGGSKGGSKGVASGCKGVAGDCDCGKRVVCENLLRLYLL